jgi:hypothetical protein
LRAASDPLRAVVCVRAVVGSGFPVVVVVELRSSLAVLGIRVDWVGICNRLLRIFIFSSNNCYGGKHWVDLLMLPSGLLRSEWRILS